MPKPAADVHQDQILRWWPRWPWSLSTPGRRRREAGSTARRPLVAAPAAPEAASAPATPQEPSSTPAGNGTLAIAGGPDPLAPPSTAAAAAPQVQILVRWSTTSTAADRLAALTAVGGRLMSSLQSPLMASLGQGPVEVIALPPGLSAERAIATYGRRPGVELAELDGWVGVEATSNDPFYTTSSRLWGMYSGDNPTLAGPSGTTNAFGSQAEQAWANGHTGSTQVVVGVIDTGIDYTHPDLYLNIWLNQGEIRGLSIFNQLSDSNGDGLISFHDLNHVANAPFVSDINLNGRIDAGDLLRDSRWADGTDNDANGRLDDLIGWDFFNNSNDPYRASDGDNHGTHVAGTIGGIGGNGLGVAGVNWTVQLMALKFLGPNGGSTSGAIAAVDYYANMTRRHDREFGGGAQFVGTSNSWGGGSYSGNLLTAITNGARVGNLFVAAAGNNSADNDLTARYPTNYSTRSALGWDAVVSVAAITSSGSLASFSNWGATTVDLGAPGASINSTVAGGGYASYSGTSMATPHVSGAIALYAAAHPSATPQQILEALYGSVVATDALAGRTVSGGRLDVNQLLASSDRSDAPATGNLAVSGSHQQGATLTANTAAISDPDGTLAFSFQWQASSDNLSWLDISGATTSSFAIPDDQSRVGQFIRLRAIAADPYGATTSFLSLPAEILPTSQPVSLNFTGSADSLTGTTGSADTFRLLRLSDALLNSNPDRIINLEAGVDGIDTPSTRTTPINPKVLGSVSALTARAIGTVLTNRQFSRDTAATFSFGSGSNQRIFLAINDSNHGFQEASDAVIEITGWSGSLEKLSLF